MTPLKNKLFKIYTRNKISLVCDIKIVPAKRESLF